MRLRKMFKNKLAFTLVELVIAIAVMAILAGAVAGAVVGIRDSARKSAVTTPAATIKTELDSYYQASYTSTGSLAKEIKENITNDFANETGVEIIYKKSPAAEKPSAGNKLKIVIGAEKDASLANTISKIYVCTDFYSVEIACTWDSGKFIVNDKPVKF